MNLGFLASHNGSNMQALIDACSSGRLEAKPTVTISNNSHSGALRRADKEKLPWFHLSAKTHPDPEALDRAIASALNRHSVDLVILAGYMKKLGPAVLTQYAGRILNIHPSLLPKFGGAGMYGIRVHEAVLAAGETETGVSVHLVDGDYDTGPVLAQSKLAVLPGDTAESLAARVLEREHQFFAETLQRLVCGELQLPEPAPVAATS